MRPEKPDIICIGAMLWDYIGRSAARLNQGDDVPGKISLEPGGVALNVALALSRYGLRCAILSAVARDPEGEALVKFARQQGIDTDWIQRDGYGSTDSYVAIESSTGLFAAIADTRGLEAAGTSILAPLRDGRLGDAQTPWCGQLVIDGNLTTSTLTTIAREPSMCSAELRVIPASPDKATRLWPLLSKPRATFHLNLAEAEALTSRSFRSAARAAEAVLALGAHRVIVTDGANLVADAMRGGPTLAATPPRTQILRITGAGDAFLAAHLAAERAGSTREEALKQAVMAAAIHISGSTIPESERL